MEASASSSIGDLLRGWRKRRRWSQLDLAVEAGISQRHLSFVESGRSAPSRDMVLHLAEQLRVPVRARNVLLTAAGFAPVFGERSLDAPDMQAARNAVALILKGHEPHPALAVDRTWNLVAANGAVGPFLEEVDAALLTPPINVLRLSLHPNGLAPRIGNYHQWREHVLLRLGHQLELTADAQLAALLEELRAFPTPSNAGALRAQRGESFAGIAVPFELLTSHGTLSFLSTTTVFGTAVDVSLSELVIETFFPLDEQTAETMRQI